MAAFVSCRSLFSLAFAVSLSFLFLLSIIEARNGGYSIELIHRDSPKSPFYNPNETPYQRLANAFRRSINRRHRFDPTFVSQINSPQAGIISNDGDYLMNISIGTPPVEILAVADTGSDLIWTQCKPCIQCYKQEAPVFDPEHSSTYEDLLCFSRQCSSLPETSCSDDFKCSYESFYKDNSFSKGSLAADTVTLDSTSGQPVALPDTTFGCGHNNSGNFDPRTTGVIGLGRGPVSLISQMGNSIGGKFSYCLTPFFSEHPSKIKFGRDGTVPPGPGVVSTPLISGDSNTFYFVKLEAISVSQQRIVFNDISSYGNEAGTIMIDSGSTLTFLPQEYNSLLLIGIASLIEEDPIPDPDHIHDLCYNYSSVREVPEITLHFSGGDLKLNIFNYYIRTREEVACFVFKGSDGLPLYGNLMQANFLIGYDTQGQTVSFKQTDCSRE
ncbi:aspartic proteinase CDR1-like [Melia azedarach]|uniref:Aspartic proteinase CDR1-like n=1 Tax=Melia azedarach TaxID=155640 RepID=A0ACC1YE35_MELAZ|nr:aspartic proteinase CDR1-like [Melia azedarach]